MASKFPSSQRPFSPQDLLTQKKRGILVRTTTPTTTSPSTTIVGSTVYAWNRPASAATFRIGGAAQRISPAVAGTPGIPKATLPCCSSS